MVLQQALLVRDRVRLEVGRDEALEALHLLVRLAHLLEKRGRHDARQNRSIEAPAGLTPVGHPRAKEP